MRARPWQIALVGLACGVASAEPKPPCARCTLDVPKTEDAVPLLVVLHGDREHAASAAARWRAATKRAGWALLALECPRDLGCKDSFWKWDGDPGWVAEQVAAVAKQRAIDPAKIYLAGWSGGATYIGWHLQAWPATFAGIVIHGGGDAPADASCTLSPVYFLVGDRNPLHHLVVRLRDHVAGCQQTFTWDLVKGADHGKEEAALSAKKASAILAWLTSAGAPPR
jgi:predicted esterase